MVHFFFYVIMCKHNLDSIRVLKIERLVLLLPLNVECC